jgi:cephalosporin hydroxylase
MKLTIDTDTRTLTIQDENATRTIDLYSDEAFMLISRQWVKVGWNQKYSYTFSWLGRPIIQLPEDMLRVQEVIFALQPDVIVETGVAHGGSLVFYASLCHAMGQGRVIGIDIEIRTQNRVALEQHKLSSYITLIEGSSTSNIVLDQVRANLKTYERVLVILDSNHSYQHVMDELSCYADLVSSGSYLLVADGIMRDLGDVPRGQPNWLHDNPVQAALDFAAEHPEFVLEQPGWQFNESTLRDNITYYPCGWLRKR